MLLNLYLGVEWLRRDKQHMKTTTQKPAEKKNRQRNFRPSAQNEMRLEFASRLGFNVSEIINEVLEKGMDTVLKSKTEAMQKELSGMVRGGGFEPPTPTVSR